MNVYITSGLVIITGILVWCGLAWTINHALSRLSHSQKENMPGVRGSLKPLISIYHTSTGYYAITSENFQEEQSTLIRELLITWGLNPDEQPAHK